MAVQDTFRTYNGDGVTTDFPVTFTYELPTEVTVKISGVATTAWFFINPSVIRLNSPLAVGTTLTVERITNIDNPAVLWKNGSGTTGSQLNAMVRQLINAMQEARDTALRGLFRLATGEYDFVNARAINLGNPVLPKDAVNKQWAETGMSSQLAIATAARDTAVTASTEAVSAKDVAVDRAGSATASASTSVIALNQTEEWRDEVAAMRDTVAADAALVQTYDVTAMVANAAAAVTAKNDAVTAKNAAEAAKTLAEASRDKSNDFANALPNTEVEAGKFSARHWASVAQNVGQATATNIGFTPFGNLAALNVQLALQELDTEKAKLNGGNTLGGVQVFTSRPRASVTGTGGAEATGMKWLTKAAVASDDLGIATSLGWQLDCIGAAHSTINTRNNMELNYWDGSTFNRAYAIDSGTRVMAISQTPTFPTATAGDNTTKGATTAFVTAALTTALTAKANVSHAHAIADVTGLATALGTKYEYGSHATFNNLWAIATASPTTGTVYLGNSGVRYLHYDGSNYVMPNADLYVAGSRVVRASEFPALAQSNGYQKLPTGMIIQWGAVFVAGGAVVINFPIAFPNGLVQVVATPEVFNGGGACRTTQTYGVSNAGMGVLSYAHTATTLAYNAEVVRWIAVGW